MDGLEVTTIAWDGKTLAWDSQITQGECKSIGEKGRRIKTPAGPVTVVVCGEVSYLDVICEALSKGKKLPKCAAKDCGIVILRGGKLFGVNGRKEFPIVGHSCQGTGSMAAMAGLAHGMTAKQAVALACKVDLYSSLPVNSARR